MKQTNVDSKGKKRRKFVKLLLLIVFILGLIVAAFNTDYFNVKSVEVCGNSIVSSEEIDALSQLKGKNLFTINKGEAVKKILQNPYVKGAKIKRIIPSKVLIAIDEKKIKGIVKYNNQFIDIDEDGKMVQIINKFPDGSIPLLEGIKIQQYIPDEYVFKSEESKRKALKEVLCVTNFKESKNVINRIQMIDSNNIIIGTVYGIDIRIGDSSNLEHKISYALSILDLKELKGRKGYIKINQDGTANFVEK